MAAAAARGLPVPRVEAAGAWRERPALLLAWCPGRTFLAELRARPWRAGPLGVLFGRAQAAIHATPAPEPLARRPDAWLAWAGPDESALQAGLRALGARSDALLHLDYHLLNVMTDGRRVTGVLDWANARAGDPRADLARTLTILRLDSRRVAGSPPARLLARGVVRLFERGWRRGYRGVAGRPTGLAPFYAWAGAVMARDLAPTAASPAPA